MSVIGVVLGHVGYSQSKISGVGGGEAISGLILNWFQVAILLVLLFAGMVLGAGVMASSV